MCDPTAEDDSANVSIAGLEIVGVASASMSVRIIEKINASTDGRGSGAPRQPCPTRCSNRPKGRREGFTPRRRLGVFRMPPERVNRRRVGSSAAALTRLYVLRGPRELAGQVCKGGVQHEAVLHRSSLQRSWYTHALAGSRLRHTPTPSENG